MSPSLALTLYIESVERERLRRQQGTFIEETIEDVWMEGSFKLVRRWVKKYDLHSDLLRLANSSSVAREVLELVGDGGEDDEDSGSDDDEEQEDEEEDQDDDDEGQDVSSLVSNSISRRRPRTGKRILFRVTLKKLINHSVVVLLKFTQRENELKSFAGYIMGPQEQSDMHDKESCL